MYATARDILDRYGHVGAYLSGLTEEGEPDTEALDRALEEAGSEIDAALRAPPCLHTARAAAHSRGHRR